MILAPIWQRYDQNAWAWIQAVEKADAQHLEPGVRAAMNQLVLDMKANSLWTPVQTMVVKMGARTLSGALVDIKNPSSSWTNNNFVSGDYNRTTGLIGNTTTKYLNTGRAGSSDSQDDFAMWTYQSTAVSASNRWLMGNTRGATGGNEIRASSGDLRFYSRNNTSDTDTGANAAGLVGTSRSASGSYTSRGAQADQSNTRTSQTTATGTFFDHATNDAGVAASWHNHRSQASAIGAAHSLSTMETVFATFVDSITALGL
jgi:hypothetical protein